MDSRIEREGSLSISARGMCQPVGDDTHWSLPIGQFGRSVPDDDPCGTADTGACFEGPFRASTPGVGPDNRRSTAFQEHQLRIDRLPSLLGLFSCECSISIETKLHPQLINRNCAG